MKSLSIYLAQLNPVVGDIRGNIQLVRYSMQQARKSGADIVVYPELMVSGYPPEDLVLKPAFQQTVLESVQELAASMQPEDPALVLGAPWLEAGKLYNSVCFLHAGKIQAVRHKHDLPNYSVFDEKRVFSAGPVPKPVEFNGVKLGLPICEDIWFEGVETNICEELVRQGADLLLVANGSPYSDMKIEERLCRAVARSTETGIPLVYVNQIGGQDELVFDGRSFVADKNGGVPVMLEAWVESGYMTRWEKNPEGWRIKNRRDTASEVSPDVDENLEMLEDHYRACVVGLRDYILKNHFPGVVLGLSGGIDSALCAAIAVDALGPDKVHCIMLPYTYTSEESLKDAAACAQALGVKYDVIPIRRPVTTLGEELAELFAGQEPGVTEENIQSRMRGVILMAVSNKFGSMVVTTGNKSEMSVGYATLYGDMNGGFNPIKDMYKSDVYAISSWRNQHMPVDCLGPVGEVIPKNILTKPPSAELRPDQTDQDSLPPYDILDDILACLVEKEMSVGDIVKRGHHVETVRHISHLLYIAEYKRRQAAPGVKLSARNFGRDRRYPITNGFRE